MANRLKMADISKIRTLHGVGWSNRRIAHELGIHRDTVARYVNLSKSKQASAPAGFIGHEGRSRQGQPSQCEVFREKILTKLESHLSAQRIYQDLIEECGFTGSYYSVRRFVRRLGKTRELPVRRVERPPAQEAQVDFGRGAPVVQPDGRRRQTWVFRIVLSHSRKAYSEAVYRQTTDEFIRCLENAFWHFGGVVQTLVIDNLRAAVKKPDWYDPELTPKIQSFCEHYHVAILPTKPYTPRHKGKVEKGVHYVKDNGLKARRFTSLEEQNRHLLDWETRIADTRIHGTTRKQVAKLFREIERPALQTLPLERFPCFHEKKQRVHRDGHVEVDKAYYSVPTEYLGHDVWVRRDSRLVRIYTLRMELIATHVRSEPGRFNTHNQHIAPEKISNVERGAQWLLQRSRRVGPQTGIWARAVLDVRGIEGLRVLVGLLSLTKRHKSGAIERACEIAHSHAAYHLRTIRALLKRPACKQEFFEFMQAHPIIRDLSDYSDLLDDSPFTGGRAV